MWVSSLKWTMWSIYTTEIDKCSKPKLFVSRSWCAYIITGWSSLRLNEGENLTHFMV